MQRHVAGQSIRQISRAEHRARETVSKVVRSDEMRAYVCALRERLYGLGDDALAAVEYELRQNRDATLGYRLLVDIGVVPCPQERPVIQVNRETQPQVPGQISASQRGLIERLVEHIAYMESAFPALGDHGRPGGSAAESNQTKSPDKQSNISENS
jgi:hypothetical protein